MATSEPVRERVMELVGVRKGTLSEKSVSAPNVERKITLYNYVVSIGFSREEYAKFQNAGEKKRKAFENTLNMALPPGSLWANLHGCTFSFLIHASEKLLSEEDAGTFTLAQVKAAFKKL